MKRYATVVRIMRPWWTYGVTVDRDYIRPSLERWSSGEWMVQGLGLSIWRFARTTVTVGERGVW